MERIIYKIDKIQYCERYNSIEILRNAEIFETYREAIKEFISKILFLKENEGVHLIRTIIENGKETKADFIEGYVNNPKHTFESLEIKLRNIIFKALENDVWVDWDEKETLIEKFEISDYEEKFYISLNINWYDMYKSILNNVVNNKNFTVCNCVIENFPNDQIYSFNEKRLSGKIIWLTEVLEKKKTKIQNS